MPLVFIFEQKSKFFNEIILLFLFDLVDTMFEVSTLLHHQTNNINL
jgi:hypothetical protein